VWLRPKGTSCSKTKTAKVAITRYFKTFFMSSSFGNLLYFIGLYIQYFLLLKIRICVFIVIRNALHRIGAHVTSYVHARAWLLVDEMVPL
jgi:hypothetical protein